MINRKKGKQPRIQRNVFFVEDASRSEINWLDEEPPKALSEEKGLEAQVLGVEAPQAPEAAAEGTGQQQSARASAW